MQYCETIRELSVASLPLLGGETGGKIYKLNEKRVVKEYSYVKTPKAVEELANYTNVLQELGVPVETAHEVVKTETGYGIVYDYLDGKSLGCIMDHNPEKIDEYASRMGKLFHKMHETSDVDGKLINVKERLFAQIDRTCELGYTNPQNKESLIHFVKRLPDDNKILHCDFNEGNIIEQNGEFKIIDTDEACSGSPVFDLAFFFQTEYMVAFTPKICRDSHHIKSRYVHRIYYRVLQEYWGGVDKKTVKKNVWELRYLVLLLLALNPARLEGTDMVNNKKILKFLMCKVVSLCVFFIKRGMERTDDQ